MKEIFKITKTLNGGYGVTSNKSNSPWPYRFNITLEEAKQDVKDLNQGKLNQKLYKWGIRWTQKNNKNNSND